MSQCVLKNSNEAKIQMSRRIISALEVYTNLKTEKWASFQKQIKIKSHNIHKSKN